jgi:hypothetical protein
MPTWSNTDAPNLKPKWDAERQTREVLQFTVLTGNTSGNNIIQVAYNDGAGNNVANVGVATGQYVYFLSQGNSSPVAQGTAGNGYPGMFFSNTTVASISGNTVTLAQNLFNTVSAGYGVEFDKAIAYNANKPVETTYNKDTVLVTATRLANTQIGAGGVSQGWAHVQKKTNSDGTVRYIRETLVALANPVASNTFSGNTSWGTAFTGV